MTASSERVLKESGRTRFLLDGQKRDDRSVGTVGGHIATVKVGSQTGSISQPIGHRLLRSHADMLLSLLAIGIFSYILVSLF